MKYSESASIVKGLLNEKGILSVWDLFKLLNWTRGKAQTVTDKMINKKDLFFKHEFRDGKYLKLLSLKPFPESDQKDLVMNESKSKSDNTKITSKLLLQDTIIKNFIRLSLDDILNFLKEKLQGKVDFSQIPSLIAEKINIGKIALDKTLRKQDESGMLGFEDGINDKRLKELFE